MVNYSQGKIYKIVDNTNGDIYVGSTCETTLAKRLSKHIQTFKTYKQGKSGYASSYKIIENDDYDIILIENYPCETRDQLHSRERHYIETLPCVNLIIPTRTHKEWVQANKEHIQEKLKEYSKTNEIRLKQYQENYREKNKEQNKEYKKEYYQNNKEYISEKSKLRYEAKKDEINEKRRKDRLNKTK